MSTLSVVQYNTSPLKMQQPTSERREIIILRKAPQALQQQKESKQQDNILITNTARKRPKSGKEITRTQNPPPIAVARRNARERNRVKQVNNGFATLRQHIPNSIAAAFESSSGRGGNKKLSKVETLRMAVEYIRSLEELLSDDSSEISENVSSSSISLSSLHSPSPSSPAFTTKTSVSYTYPLTSPSIDDDDLSTNPTPPPQQYIRMNGSNTYQIIPAHLYEDSENLEPIEVADHLLADPGLIDADFGVQDLSLLANMHANHSLSPGIYSDDSLSPGTAVKSEPQTYIPVFQRQLSPHMDDLKVIVGSEIKVEPPVLSLQNEAELPPVHKENMIDVIAWWEQQQQQTSRS